MKKAFYLICIASCCMLLVCTNTKVFAQYQGIGATVGVGIRTLNVMKDYGNGTSFRIGVLSSFRAADNAKFEPEFAYSLKGSGEEHYDLNLHYLEMVLPLKIQVTGPWYWVAGGRIGFLTKAEVIPDEGQKETVTGEFDKMDAGIVSGFEVSITENLACFATADIGIHDITNNGETYNFSLTGGLNYRWRK